MSDKTSEQVEHEKKILKDLFIAMVTKISDQLDFMLQDKNDMKTRKQLEESFIDIFQMYRRHTRTH